MPSPAAGRKRKLFSIVSHTAFPQLVKMVFALQNTSGLSRCIQSRQRQTHDYADNRNHYQQFN